VWAVTTLCHGLLRETAVRGDYLAQRDHAEFVRRADAAAEPLSAKQQVGVTLYCPLSITYLVCVLGLTPLHTP